MERYIVYDEVGMGQNQFRCFYMAFHPISRALVVHEGHTGKVYIDGRLVYDYSTIGKPPRAGGDTHGAIAWSRDLVFIGGWIKAPAGLLISSTNRTLIEQDMRDKYSHIHAIDRSGNVKILWLRKWDEKLPPNHWYGEVTDLLYDGHEDSLYFTRADGYEELGLWRISLSDAKAEWIIRSRTLYKMEMKDDKIFSTLFNPAHLENSAIAIYDTINGNSKFIEFFDFGLETDKKISIKREGGQIVQIQNKLYAFYGGCIIICDPYKDKYILYPFLEAVSPESEKPLYIPGLRSQKAYVFGVPIIAANTSEGSVEPSIRTSPGLLIRLDPVSPQILTTTGFVSGMVSDGRYLYIGTSYANHCPVYTYRSGDGGIYAIPVKELFTKPWVPIRMWLYDNTYIHGKSGIAGWFGGIPLKGFGIKKLRVYTSKEVKMRIAEYNFLTKISEDTITLNIGWNVIDLSSYYDIVSFKFEEDVEVVRAELIAEP